MRLRAILFDLDGTLVSSLPGLIRIYRELLAEQGIEVDAEDLRRWLAIPWPHFPEPLLARVDMARFETGLVAREFSVRNSTGCPLAVPEVATLLPHLAELKIQTAICSNASEADIRAVLDAHGFTDRFDAVLGRDSVSAAKPDPEMALKACDLLGCEPHEALFVGDSLSDLGAARAAGIPFVGVLTGAADAATFKKEKADYILPHVGALVEIIDHLAD